MPQPLIESLEESEVFSQVDKSTLISMREFFEEVHLAANEFLFQEGDFGDRLYILVRGKLEVLKKGNADVEAKLAEKGVGSLIGLTSLISENKVRSASLRAIRHVSALSISKEDFRKILTENRDLAFNFLAYLAKELRQESTDIAKLMTEKADNRFKLKVFDAKKYEKTAFAEYLPEDVEVQYLDARLDHDSVRLAKGAPASRLAGLLFGGTIRIEPPVSHFQVLASSQGRSQQEESNQQPSKLGAHV